jgi:hypothetical protein
MEEPSKPSTARLATVSSLAESRPIGGKVRLVGRSVRLHLPSLCRCVVLRASGRILGFDVTTSIFLVDDGTHAVLVDLGAVLDGDAKLPRLRETVMVIGDVEQTSVRPPHLHPICVLGYNQLCAQGRPRTARATIARSSAPGYLVCR